MPVKRITGILLVASSPCSFCAEVGVLRDLHELGMLQRISVVTGEWHFEDGKAAVREYLSETHDLEIMGDVKWNQFYATKTQEVECVPSEV